MVKKKEMCSLQNDVPGANIGMIKIRELHDFKEHPYKVERNQELFELSRSIEQEGILVPLLVRKNPGEEGFESLQGIEEKKLPFGQESKKFRLSSVRWMMIRHSSQ